MEEESRSFAEARRGYNRKDKISAATETCKRCQGSRKSYLLQVVVQIAYVTLQ